MANVIWPATLALIATLLFVLIMWPTSHARQLMARLSRVKVGTSEVALEDGGPPKAATAPAADVAQPPPPEPEALPIPTDTVADDTGKQRWQEVLALYLQRDCEKADARLEGITGTMDPVRLAVLRGWGHSQCGRADATDILLKACSDYPGDPRPHRFLAQIYAESGDHEQARVQYMQAAALAGEDGASDLISAAAALQSADRRDEAIGILVEGTKRFPQSAALCKALGLAYKEAGRELPAIAFLERAVELSPTDAGLRFSVAYNESGLGWENLAWFNYSRISGLDQPFTENNLGVACDRLGLPIAAVEQYRKATSLGSSLAASNSASLLLSAGFAREAEETCTKAANESPGKTDPRVFHVLTEVSGKREAERKKTAEMDARVLKIRPYLARLAQPPGETPSEAVLGRWKAGEEAELALTSESGEIGKLTETAAKSSRALTGGIRGSALSCHWVRRNQFFETGKGVGFGYVEKNTLRLLLLRDQTVEEMTFEREVGPIEIKL